MARAARSSTASTVYSAGTQSSRSKPGLGSIVKYIQVTNCLLSFVLFLSSFERLEWLADRPLVDLHLYIPYSAPKLSILVDTHSQILVYIGLLLHVLSMKLSTKKIIISELLNYVLWPLAFVLNLIPVSNEDRLIYRMIFNSLAFVLSASNLLVRRQPKERRKPHLYTSPPSSATNPFTSIKPRSPSRVAVNSYGQLINSDEDMNTSKTLELLPDLARDNPELRECTPFTEISGRLNSLTLDFAKERTPTKLFFTPPKSQAPRMLSSAAITPSSKRIQSPFSSLKFHGLSKQPHSTELTWSQPSFTSTNSVTTKTPSLLSTEFNDARSEITEEDTARPYNLRARTPSSRASSVISSKRPLQSAAMRSVMSFSNSPSSGPSLSSHKTPSKKKRNKMINLIISGAILFSVVVLVKYLFF